MPTNCCVPGCSNRENSHKLPWSDKKRLKEWVVAIRRDKWTPKKYSVVCSRHFRPEDYQTKTTYGTNPLQKKLKPTAVPSVFHWSKTVTQAEEHRQDRCIRRDVRALLLDVTSEVARRLEEEQIICEPLGATEEVTTSELDTSGGTGLTYMDTCVQTEEPQLQETGVQTSAPQRAPFTVTDFVNDDKGVHFYTGLETYQKLCFVLSTLCPAAYRLNYYTGVNPTISIPDQFFITLIKLRRNKTYFELSRMFNITESCISNIFITWINFMYMHWSEQPWWPSRDLVRYFSPTDFKQKYPDTRVIVDGTECPIKKPAQPVAQQATYSNYKNRNTVKVLVGVTPGGLVSHVSTAYGGSASDRQIVERSNLPQSCDSGDSVMADKGFNVQDIFIPHNVVLNIPTFFSNTNRMSGETVLKDRRIASKRVHVERIIGLGKTYTILTSPMDNTQSALSSRIIAICFMLTNFRKCIVPKHA